MKAIIAGLVFITGVLDALTQGTVIFNNRLGRTEHVYCGPYAGPYWLVGTVGSPLAASTTYASLLGISGYASTDIGMVAGDLGTALGNGTATSFRTGAASGNIAPAFATFDNIPKDAPTATFEMVAWDNSSGLYSTWALASVAWQGGLVYAGKSDLFNFTVPIGGDWNTPPYWGDITPGQSTTFEIIFWPEPSSLGLFGLAVGVWAVMRGRRVS